MHIMKNARPWRRIILTVLAVPILLGLIMLAASMADNRLAQRVPILMYHRVADDAPDDVWTVTIADFEHQLSQFKAEGYRTYWPDEITWRRILGGKRPLKPLILTFDDGDVSVMETVEPLLEKYGFKAIAYCATAQIADMPDGRRSDAGHRYLTWLEIRAMRARGILAIGAHGYQHIRADLAKDPALEITRCLDDFSRKGNFSPASYSYPFGMFQPAGIRMLRAHGVTTAVTCSERYARIAWQAKPMKLPRFWMRGGRHVFTVTPLPGPTAGYEIIHQGIPLAACIRWTDSNGRLLAAVEPPRLLEEEMQCAFPGTPPPDGVKLQIWDQNNIYRIW